MAKSGVTSGSHLLKSGRFLYSSFTDDSGPLQKVVEILVKLEVVFTSRPLLEVFLKSQRRESIISAATL